MTEEELETAGEICELCPMTRGQHRKAQEKGLVKHIFSEDGNLTAIKPPKDDKKKPEGVPSGVYSIPGGDPVLRMILVEKGIITTDELDHVESLLRSVGVIRSGENTPNMG